MHDFITSLCGTHEKLCLATVQFVLGNFQKSQLTRTFPIVHIEFCLCSQHIKYSGIHNEIRFCLGSVFASVTEHIKIFTVVYDNR